MRWKWIQSISRTRIWMCNIQQINSHVPKQLEPQICIRYKWYFSLHIPLFILPLVSFLLLYFSTTLSKHYPYIFPLSWHSFWLPTFNTLLAPYKCSKNVSMGTHFWPLISLHFPSSLLFVLYHFVDFSSALHSIGSRSLNDQNHQENPKPKIRKWTRNCLKEKEKSSDHENGLKSLTWEFDRSLKLTVLNLSSPLPVVMSSNVLSSLNEGLSLSNWHGSSCSFCFHIKHQASQFLHNLSYKYEWESEELPSTICFLHIGKLPRSLHTQSRQVLGGTWRERTWEATVLLWL